MKIKLIVIVICLFGNNLLFKNGYSQNTGFIGTISSGINFPIATISDNYKNGHSINGKLGYKFNSHLAIGINVDYNSFGPNNNDKTINHGGNFVHQSVKVFFMFTNFEKSTKIFPYGLLAFGVNMKNYGPINSTKYGVSPGSGFINNFGMDIGGGLGYRAVKNISLFIEPKFTGTFENRTTMLIDLRVGMMFTP